MPRTKNRRCRGGPCRGRCPGGARRLCNLLTHILTALHGGRQPHRNRAYTMRCTRGKPPRIMRIDMNHAPFAPRLDVPPPVSTRRTAFGVPHCQCANRSTSAANSSRERLSTAFRRPPPSESAVEAPHADIVMAASHSSMATAFRSERQLLKRF